MTKKLEDYELTPESEGSDKNKTIWAKWRARWEKANEKLFEENPEDAKQQLDDMYKTYGQIVGKETKPRGLTSLSGLFLDRQVFPKPQRLMDEGKEGAFIDVGTGAYICLLYTYPSQRDS